MKKISSTFKVLLILICILTLPFLLLNICRADVAMDAGFDQGNQVSSSDIGSIIGQLIKSALGLIVLVFVILIIIAGVIVMISRGDPEKTAKAKKVIFSAVIGLIIILLSYAIIAYILKIFQPPNYIVGDVNGNGAIDATDLNLIKQIAIGSNIKCYDLDNHEINCIKVADVNHDGKVDNTDIDLVKKILVQ